MKTGMRWACLCGTVLVAAELREDPSPEIRVWLIDPEGNPVDLEGMSATLTVTDLKGWKKIYVMPAVPSRGEATVPPPSRGEIRKVPGTPYLAELLFVAPVSPAAPESSDEPQRVFDLPHLPRPSAAGEGARTSEAPGPSFRTPLSKEILPKQGGLGVHLSLPDGRKCSVRWTLPLWAQEKPCGEGWVRPWDDLAELDRHLRSEKIDRARDAADRLIGSLQNALQDAELDAKKSEECLGAAREIRRRLAEGEHEEALRSMGDCRARFRELAPFPDRLDPGSESR